MLKMRQVLLALCTVCALLCTVNSLDCLKCDGGTSCFNTVSQTCSSSETCLTFSSTSLGFQQFGFTQNGFVKKCGPKLQTCGQLLSAKFTNQLRVESRVECCDTNQCNTGVYNVALTVDSWNGKQCPSCVSTGSCGTDLVNCLGTQDQCITVTGAAPGIPTVTLKGCATKAACDKGSLLMAWPFLSNLQVACYAASASGDTEPAVNSLVCLKCDGGTSCSNTVSQTCSSSETCLTFSSTSLGFQQFGFTQNGFVKKCGPKLQTCGQLLSAKFTNQIRVESRVECCDTNQCNTGVYDVALTVDSWNGKQCPSCVGTGSCGTDLVNCLGTQDQCITVTGASPGIPTVTLKGCATKAACDKDSLLTAWPFLSNLQVACKVASTNGFIPLGINMFMIAGAASLALGFVLN